MTNPLPFPNALRDRQLVVVDVEGNGQNPPEIIEIAVLLVDGPTTPDALRSWLIQPRTLLVKAASRRIDS